jgi:hypothetical protein
MKWYGSLTNRLEENAKPKDPEVGDGVTEYCYSDRHAYTVCKVISPKLIAITRDIATRIDRNGQSESQEYRYETSYEHEPILLRKNIHGHWKMIGDPQGSTYVVGLRDEYEDPCF